MLKPLLGVVRRHHFALTLQVLSTLEVLLDSGDSVFGWALRVWRLWIDPSLFCDDMEPVLLMGYQ